jgi:hypothetical protein
MEGCRLDGKGITVSSWPLVPRPAVFLATSPGRHACDFSLNLLVVLDRVASFLP